MDQEQLHTDILSALPQDLLYIAFQKEPQPRWSIDSEGFLHHDNITYVPDYNDLRLRVLRYKHDHILSGHPGQNKTIDFISHDYT
jgi:hypothetical protein